MTRLACLFLLISFFVGQSFAEDKHTLFTDMLKAYVRRGVADYKSLCKDPRFMRYIDQLKQVNPDTLGSGNEALAFWLNTYNAWTLKIVCDKYPLKSITELHSGGAALAVVFKTTVWDKNLVTVYGKLTSLGFIEHKILRPKFKDARIHFALVCAAKGCPPLRSEAYEADRIDAQLDEQGRVFLADRGKNEFDIENKVAHISPIFGWFKTDFGARKEAVLRYLSEFAPPGARGFLKDGPGEWKLSYTSYDWSLNE
jgi:hypothetical protein